MWWVAISIHMIIINIQTGVELGLFSCDWAMINMYPGVENNFWNNDWASIQQ
jgi:hypothetical protein